MSILLSLDSLIPAICWITYKEVNPKTNNQESGWREAALLFPILTSRDATFVHLLSLDTPQLHAQD